MIAIVGRANVGKSTLFNRLVEKNQAMVSPVSGTTRDVNFGQTLWRGKNYQVVDTGGLDIAKPANTIEAGIINQAKNIIDRALVIVFLIDAKTGVMPGDKMIARQIARTKKSIILVANKADSAKYRQVTKEIISLGLGEPLFVSAATGSGVGDLLDEATSRLPANLIIPEKPADEKRVKITLLGKPNVGKSSLLNSLLGEQRVIVSEIPHTTREAHFVDFKFENQDFTLIDTAGLRKKAKIEKGLEKMSVEKSLYAARIADVVLLVTDASEPLTIQDNHLTQEIAETKASIILIANKWDLSSDRSSLAMNKMKAYYQQHFPYLAWAPIMFVSAKTGLNVKKVLKLASEVAAEREKIITPEDLNTFLKSSLKRSGPLREAKRRLQRGGTRPQKLVVYKIEQIGVRPPKFTLLVNNDQLLHFSFVRFIQNRLRDVFGFIGTPLILTTEEKRKADKK